MISIEKTNLRDKAYDKFTQHLLARKIRPGQFISQRQLVELTGLPLAAIRELIPRLETEGLITTIPQRGLQIASVDINLIRDAFQFRLFLEREAVAEFAVTARAVQVKALREEHLSIIETIRALSDADVPPDLISRAQVVDQKLHNSIIEALGNKVIADAYRVNAMKISLVRQEQGRLNDELVLPAMMDHIAIIDAIEARDPQKAAEAMTIHIMKGCNRALGIR